MRHQKSERKLGRNSAHRKAMYRNMVTSLLEHERIKTTHAKAKELRGKMDRVITIAKRIGDILEKPAEKRSQDEKARVAHAMRLAAKTIRSREIVHKLFEEIAPRFKGRPGGYTRIFRTGRRVGDAAEMAIIEFVTDEEKAESAA